MQYIVFRLGDDRYAVPVTQIATILRNDVRLAQPLPAPGRVGLRDYQGHVWNVVDLGYLLKHQETTPTGQEMLLLLWERRAGVLVSEVLAVQTVQAEEIKTVRLDDGDHQVAHLKSGLAAVLDLEAVVDKFLAQENAA